MCLTILQREIKDWGSLPQTQRQQNGVGTQCRRAPTINAYSLGNGWVFKIISKRVLASKLQAF